MNQQRLLERFLRYVKVHTTADDDATTYPSSSGQWELGRLLVEELSALGLDDVHQDEHGLVWATVPGNVTHEVPTIALNAHLDTSPETTGKSVNPQVVADYQGGDIVLPADQTKVIRVAENLELDQLRGCTLITTDGTTLLGADDKAGIAIIVESAAYLVEHPEIKHGPIRLLFTCDEEIGRGVDHVDFAKLGAAAAYTLDGGGANDIDVETFSADRALVTFYGINIHPSIAKDRMVNAIRAAGEFISRLPREMSPERTAGRDGFLHPYQIEGGVAEVQLQIILRDFETEALTKQADQLREIAHEAEASVTGARVVVDIQKHYRNMADGLPREPRAVDFAKQAHERLGRTPRLSIIRGGTDGSQLTERGLPTPNLSSGQHNPHSPLEWACLEEMSQACEIVVQIAQIWAE